MNKGNDRGRWSVVCLDSGPGGRRRQVTRTVRSTKKDAEAELRRLIAESKQRGGGFASDDGPAPEVTRGDE